MDISRILEIIDVSTEPPNSPVKIDVALTKPKVTSSRTAQLVFSVENTTGEEISVSPFPRVVVPDHGGGIALERSERTPPPTCPNDAEHIEFPAVAEAPVRIGPGAEISRSYYAFDDPTDERRYPVGTYPFTIEFGRGDEDESSESYEISFDLDVADS